MAASGVAGTGIPLVKSSGSIDSLDSAGYSDVLSSDEDEVVPRNRALELVERNSFQMVVASVIGLNTLGMAVETDVPVWNFPPGCGDHCQDGWALSNLAFTSVFAAEIVLRLCAYGCCRFWNCTNPDIFWNVFDFCVVLMAVVDILVKAVGGDGAGALVTFSRSFRILRMLRVLRLFKQLKPLRMLISGFIGSLSAVGWILVLILIITFIFAIFCTNMVGNNSELWGDEAEAIKALWGSVAKSSFSLFQIMTLDDWATLKNQVNQQLPFMEGFWILFVVLNAFVILSLLTGVMADHMNKVREMEEAEDAKLSDVEVKTLLKNIAKNFCRVNDAGEPIMYLDDFEGMVDDGDFQRQLKGIDPKLSVEREEVRDVFHILDANFNGFLTLSDLEDGIASLNDPITAKVIMEFHRCVHEAREVLEEHGELPRRHSEAPSEKALKKLAMAEKGMDNLENNVQECANRIKALITAVDAQRLPQPDPVTDDDDDDDDGEPQANESQGANARN